MKNLAAITSLRTNRPLRDLVLAGAGLIVWSFVSLGLALVAAKGDLGQISNGPPSRFHVISAYLEPVLGAFFAGMLVRIARQGGQKISRRRFWIGCALIAGAAISDLGVTFYFSPDLKDEGNPVVRALLDSGHSLPWVAAHMLLTTLMVVGTFCAFWGAFLAHLAYLLETIREAQPANWVSFLKASTGGAHLTTRQWIFPCRTCELPRLYHGIWMVGIAIVFGITLFRYYVSLEWLGVFEPALLPRCIALFAGVTGTIILYFACLFRDYRTA